MTQSDTMIRFDELSAGRALGDLSLEEERDFLLLGDQLGIGPDFAFELLAASIEVDGLREPLAALPAGLAERLHRCADEAAAPVRSQMIYPQVPAWQKGIRSPLLGWAAAAAVAIIAVLGARKDSPLAPAQAESRLRSEARDLIERKFEGLGVFKDTKGQVVWSDSLQQGYMTLSGIPVNNPKQAQYQLWIVDRGRTHKEPVDGGVFDVPSSGEIVVPIRAPLTILDPAAFAITEEPPGGVVVSERGRRGDFALVMTDAKP